MSEKTIDKQIKDYILKKYQDIDFLFDFVMNNIFVYKTYKNELDLIKQFKKKEEITEKILSFKNDNDTWIDEEILNKLPLNSLKLIILHILYCDNYETITHKNCLDENSKLSIILSDHFTDDLFNKLASVDYNTASNYFKKYSNLERYEFYKIDNLSKTLSSIEKLNTEDIKKSFYKKGKFFVSKGFNFSSVIIAEPAWNLQEDKKEFWVELIYGMLRIPYSYWITKEFLEEFEIEDLKYMWFVIRKIYRAKNYNKYEYSHNRDIIYYYKKHVKKEEFSQYFAPFEKMRPFYIEKYIWDIICSSKKYRRYKLNIYNNKSEKNKKNKIIDKTKWDSLYIPEQWKSKKSNKANFYTIWSEAIKEVFPEGNYDWQILLKHPITESQMENLLYSGYDGYKLKDGKYFYQKTIRFFTRKRNNIRMYWVKDQWELNRIRNRERWDTENKFVFLMKNSLNYLFILIFWLLIIGIGASLLFAFSILFTLILS